MNIHRLRQFMSGTQFGLFMVGTWLAYAMVLTLTVYFYNRRHRQIRAQDGTGEDPDDYDSAWDKPLAARASMAGGIFGGVAWMLAMAGTAADWLSVALILGTSIALYVWSTRRIVAGGSTVANQVLLIVSCALLLITGAAVNLRFNHWLESAFDLFETGEVTVTPQVPLWLMNLMLIAIGALILGPILVTKEIGQPARR